MAFWRALSYSKGWSFDVKTFASVLWLDFDWSHLERFSTKENSRMRWTQSGRESDFKQRTNRREIISTGLILKNKCRGKKTDRVWKREAKSWSERFSSQTPRPQTPGGHQEGRRLCSTLKSTLHQKSIKLWKVQLQYSNSTIAAGEVSRCRQCSSVEFSSSSSASSSSSSSGAVEV